MDIGSRIILWKHIWYSFDAFSFFPPNTFLWPLHLVCTAVILNNSDLRAGFWRRKTTIQFTFFSFKMIETNLIILCIAFWLILINKTTWVIQIKPIAKNYLINQQFKQLWKYIMSRQWGDVARSQVFFLHFEIFPIVVYTKEWSHSLIVTRPIARHVDVKNFDSIPLSLNLQHLHHHSFVGDPL